MAITSSAKKAIRSSRRKRGHNLKKKDALAKALKNIKKLIILGKSPEAQALYKDVQQLIDKAQKTGLIKKNNASRKKSRLAKMIKKVSATTK